VNCVTDVNAASPEYISLTICSLSVAIASAFLTLKARSDALYHQESGPMERSDQMIHNAGNHVAELKPLMGNSSIDRNLIPCLSASFLRAEEISVMSSSPVFDHGQSCGFLRNDLYHEILETRSLPPMILYCLKLIVAAL